MVEATAGLFHRHALLVAAVVSCAALVPLPANSEDDPLLDYYEQQVLVTGGDVIVAITDALTTYIAIKVRPAMIQAELERCGHCPDRQRLLEELHAAKSGAEIADQVKNILIRMSHPNPSDPHTGLSLIDEWRLGHKIYPDNVLKGPAACIPIFNRTMDCQAEHDPPRQRGRLHQPSTDEGGACWDWNNLHRLCQARDSKAFAAQILFMKNRDAGKVAAAPAQILPQGLGQSIYNVKSAADIVLPESLEDTQWSYSVDVHPREPGRLVGVTITKLSENGTSLPLSNPMNFKSPWRERLREDNRIAGSQASLLECTYQASEASIERLVFWYRTKPAHVTPRLNDRIPLHPLGRVGPAASKCPLQRSEAAASIRKRPSGEMLDTYTPLAERKIFEIRAGYQLQ